MGIGRAFSRAASVLIALLLVPASALADKPRVDWERGLFIGRGIAVGDLRSPSRQLARVKAERQAKAKGRALLLDSLGDLPWASGTAFQQKVKEEGSAELLTDSVISLHTDLGTDGSVVIEMALPLDALRALVYGSDSIAPKRAEGPSAIVIDARSLTLKPAIGYQLSDGTSEYRGPTLFYTSEAAARAHKGVGAAAPLVLGKPPAKGAVGGTISVQAGALVSLVAGRPLVVILWKGKK